MKNQLEDRLAFHTRLNGHLSKEDILLVDFAYDLSKEAHRTQKRKSGPRYFEHPRSGCLILMDELNIYEPELLISFLLHDVGEDTPLLGGNKSYDLFVATLKFRTGSIFGEKVGDIVTRLTKPFVDNIRFFTKEQVYMHYISALKESEDAMLLKMVDRLHNLRTIPVDRKEWTKNQIEETEKVYFSIFSSIQGERNEASIVLLEKIKEEIFNLKSVI